MRREDGATILDVLHAYDDVDVESVYETLKTDVPDLLERFRDATPEREST